MRAFTIAASLMASAAVVAAGPGTVVTNNCDFTVYAWTVGDQPGDRQTLAPGQSWSQGYQQRSTGGMSIKIGMNGDLWSGAPVTQFEYTYTTSGAGAGLFWDMSNINGDPFNNHDSQIVPNVPGGISDAQACPTVNCPAGQPKCAAAYNVWNDDFATHNCPMDTTLNFNICSGNKAAAPSPPAQSPAAPPAQSPSPTPAPAPKPSPSPAPAPAPAPKPAAAPAAGGYALAWAEGDRVVHLQAPGAASKRAAHENHMEKHRRIQRMHHARTAA